MNFIKKEENVKVTFEDKVDMAMKIAGLKVCPTHAILIYKIVKGIKRNKKFSMKDVIHLQYGVKKKDKKTKKA